MREQQVIVDRDLAAFYGMRTASLNRAVNRHQSRFPEDFSFVLTAGEWQQLRVERCEIVRRGGRRYVPRVFTEQGIGMLASVLRGRRAADLTIELLRAFAAQRRASDEILAAAEGKARALFDTVIDAVVMNEDERPFTTEVAVTYFLQAGDIGPIKIGSTRNLPTRLRSLQLMSPVPLRLLGVVPQDVEYECHRVLAAWRIHGEWFEPAAPVLALIRERCTVKSSDLKC